MAVAGPGHTYTHSGPLTRGLLLRARGGLGGVGEPLGSLCGGVALLGVLKSPLLEHKLVPKLQRLGIKLAEPLCPPMNQPLLLGWTTGPALVPP